MNTIRLKFNCYRIDREQHVTQLTPVLDGSEENKAYWKATPGGEFVIAGEVAANFFEVGKSYYIDVSAADA